MAILGITLMTTNTKNREPVGNQGETMKHSWKVPEFINILVVAILGICAPVTSAQFAGPSIASHGAESQATSPTTHAQYPDIEIMPGDVISITTYGAPELTTSAQTTSGTLFGGNSSVVSGIKVGARGEITLPYLGSITISGQTPSEVAVFLRRELMGRGFLVDPQVSVELVDSPMRVITVIGEVIKPEPVPAFGQLRLLDVISSCGGFTALASHTITVQRPGRDEPITVQLGVDPNKANAGDIPLIAGDTIIVPKVGNIFVVGEVKSEESFPAASNTPITVMRAISMAGGLKYSAALSKARIIRKTDDNKRVEIMLDLKKLMNGKQQDIALNSDDILFIPSNAFKATLSAGGAGVAATLLYGVTYAASNIK